MDTNVPELKCVCGHLYWEHDNVYIKKCTGHKNPHTTDCSFYNHGCCECKTFHQGKKTILEVIEELTGQKAVQYSNELKAICCPWHEDKKPSLVIYEHTSSYFCFPCSFGGDVYNFYSRFKGTSYKAAKEALDGNVDTLVEIGEYLDGLNVKDEVDYRDQLNFSISKWARDKMYQCPDQVDNILKFLEYLDKKVLTERVTDGILKRVIEESRRII